MINGMRLRGNFVVASNFSVVENSYMILEVKTLEKPEINKLALIHPTGEMLVVEAL
jgi:hypothetical protein